MTRMAATRDGYGDALLALAENEKVVVLEADLGKSTKSLHFRKSILKELSPVALVNKICFWWQPEWHQMDIYHLLAHSQFSQRGLSSK